MKRCLIKGSVLYWRATQYAFLQEEGGGDSRRKELARNSGLIKHATHTFSISSTL